MPHALFRDLSETLPFDGATDLQFRIARCFAMITNWTVALAGRYDMADVLASITRQTQAANVSLFRLEKGSASPGMMGGANRLAERHRSDPVSGLLAQYLRASHDPDLTPGSIWRLSGFRKRADFADHPAAREWQQRPEVIEVSLIVLGYEGGVLDVLELTFDVPPKRSEELPTSIITSALANVWQVRQPGIAARMIATYGRSRGPRDSATDAAILGPENPCGLSRGEQRVCQLLAEGQRAADIAQNLKCSLATVRTHLRNIYAKTGTGGQVEVITLLQRETSAMQVTE